MTLATPRIPCLHHSLPINVTAASRYAPLVSRAASFPRQSLYRACVVLSGVVLYGVVDVSMFFGSQHSSAVEDAPGQSMFHCIHTYGKLNFTGCKVEVGSTAVTLAFGFGIATKQSKVATLLSSTIWNAFMKLCRFSESDHFLYYAINPPSDTLHIPVVTLSPFQRNGLIGCEGDL